MHTCIYICVYIYIYKAHLRRLQTRLVLTAQVPSLQTGKPTPNDWAAVEEFTLSYHNRNIWKILGFPLWTAIFVMPHPASLCWTWCFALLDPDFSV